MQLQYRSHTFAQEGAGELPHNTFAPTLEDATLRMLMILVVLSFPFARFQGCSIQGKKKKSPRRDSNPQPFDPKSNTLAVAPLGHTS